MSLLKLPIEIISLIAELLHIDDLFDFGQTCRHLRYILRNESICRVALQRIKFSPEAVEAQSLHAYARGLRRLVKRRNAVRYAEPYLVAVVAMAESFIYNNGVLCYTADRENLHILDVHQSAQEELVIKIPWMLHCLDPDFQWSSLYSFRPVHYSHGIISSLYSHQDCEGVAVSWLVVLRTKDLKVLAFHRLHSTQKLFVRNNGDYLVYGTKSQPGFDGFKRWALQRLDFQKREWTSDLILWNFAGSNLGQDICFEIFDEYFYCLSNKNKLHPEHGKWNSYYHVVRFPLREATRESCKSPPMRNLWRRHAAEGPVDQRWDSLQITRDEVSGKLFIFDSRRECLPTNAQSQRTCYKKEIRFDPDDENGGLVRHPMSDILRDTLPREESSSDEEGHDPNAWDSETHIETRPPENVHIGDNGALGSMFTIGECFVRFYNSSCETFLDLIDESQRLRLRVRPKLDSTHGNADETSGTCQDQSSNTQSNTSEKVRTKLHHGVKFWPPDQTSPPNPELAQLHNILYPQIPLGEVDWAMDDRTLIYAPGHAARGRPRPLVLVSFDPAICLPGYPKMHLSSADPDGSNISPPSEPHPAAEQAYNIPETSAGSAVIDGVSGVSSVIATSDAECQRNPSEPNVTPAPTAEPWAKTYQALYMRMPKTEISPCGFDMSY
ncbi:hypothetical protein G7Z17_g6116 [Cylindrodendrum hubeiense]|uniref:F-box domain-containing protein n=1 Tax=Cylindrodendrum hubeiense TaxID=595255 RepID=A0A9P5L8I8_9HYPO|nr:hypothetical protein G7Z17_g6116 [Cylindrodendrum hubeiense]